MKMFLIDSQPEECSLYVFKISVNLSVNVLIKTVLIIKKKTESIGICEFSQSI